MKLDVLTRSCKHNRIKAMYETMTKGQENDFNCYDSIE